ncbi:MAG: RNA 2',3'-cyclic phosphodiesterase [Ignavibacteriaceae bacterium]
MKIRLFVALNIPVEIISEVISAAKNIAGRNYHLHRWEPPEKIHLTLKFIGEVEDDLLLPITSSLKFIESFPQLKCKTTKFGFFYRNNKPAILWAGLEIDPEIYLIVSELEKRMEQLGIQKENKAFKPHLTLLRVRKKVAPDFISEFENHYIPVKEFYAKTVSLFQSKLLPEGSVYMNLKSFKLKAMEGK